MSHIRKLPRPDDAAKKKAYLWGITAEWLAIAWLILKGYRILKRRYRTKSGEIDIIARKNTTLIFIEVKARKNIALALESIQPRQKIRIERAASIFAAKPPYRHHAIRFDVIVCAPWKKPHHIENAWLPMG